MFRCLYVPFLFILIFFLPFTSLASPKNISDLADEAQQYKRRVTPGEGEGTTHDDANVLQLAAQIMETEDKCREALLLYKQAIKHGATLDGSLWFAVAESARCDQEWKDATLAGYLAYLASETEQEKNTALLKLGESLEKRTSYNQDWRPAARNVYSQLLEREDSASVRAKVAALKTEKPSLVIQNYFVKTEGKRPALCLRMSEWFSRDNDTHFKDYIRVLPEIKADFTVDGREVCISGAEYNTEYAVTVRKGLSTNKAVVKETKQVTIKTGHRTPAAWFDQNAYVLPKSSSAGIAFHSINVDAINLQLYRIHERNILSDFVQSNFRRKLDAYDIEKIQGKVGEAVWQGKAEIQTTQDVHQISSLVLPVDVIEKPGLYVLVAEDADRDEGEWSGRVSQWLVVSDIGLTTYNSQSGLTVVTRSLENASLLSNINVTLFARNNKPLATKASDGNGILRFPFGLLQGTGGMEPVLLVAEDEVSGFAFLQLKRAPFDLSDRGVGGRPIPGATDTYIFSERDLYRPGETVNLVAMVRDQQGRAMSAPPMTLRLVSPDGKTSLERVLQQDDSGSFITALRLSDAVRTGTWTANVYLDVKEKPVGSFIFKVQAFMPPRLKVESTAKENLRQDSSVSVLVQADYLYGSPGSGLRIQGDMDFVVDPHPFPDFSEYLFGIDGNKVNASVTELVPAVTDEKGTGYLTCTFPKDLNSLQPLKAIVRTDVFDVDGRVVASQTVIPVRHLQQYVGIKKLFAGKRAKADSEAAFQVVVLDENGQPLENANTRYRIVEEDVDYQWFQKNDTWGYERVVNDREIENGQLNLVASNPASFSFHVEQGQYRIEILGESASVLASSRFVAGEQIVGQGDTPDAVKVILEKPKYKAGETARIHIQSPYAGEASLVIAGKKVHSIQNFSLDALSHYLEIPVGENWGAGAYALVSVYRPGMANTKGAGRAIGLVWIAIDPEGQRLGVTLHVPEQTRPRQRLTIPAVIDGAAPGEKVSMTLAAVDEGVLRLTGFKSPNPLDYFYAKQKLGTDIRDFYGQLITGPGKKPLSLRSGGGDMARRGSAQSNVRVVSLFSGVVRVGEDGKANIPLVLPDFNGQLRLMAVAWSATKMGATSRELRVADPVVVSPSLPRFLAIEDSSTMQVLLENIDGPEGKYHIQCSATGAISVQLDGIQDVVLHHGQRENILFAIGANTLGSGVLHLQVRGPEGYSYDGDFSLNVRGKFLPLLSRKLSKLDPGEVLTVDSEMIQGLYPDTAKVVVGISSSPNIDVPGLLEQLDRYPYGCLEQLTSRAMPLLYINTLADRWQYPADKAIAGRIADAIDLILQKQRSDGSFGLWSDRSAAEPWLSAYAMEFLSRAVAAGYDVPDIFFDKGLNWLTTQVQENHQPGKDEFLPLAYAHYVLARIGKGRPEDARYLFDNYLDAAYSPLAIAQLSTALALQGDIERALNGFGVAFSRENVPAELWKSYGSRLRDLAGIISVASESGIHAIDSAPVWERVTRLLNNHQYLSTQEQAWLVMAALTLDASEPLQVSINGLAAKSDDDFVSIPFTGIEMEASTEITNDGTSAVWISTTIQGSPVKDLAPEGNGFGLERHWYNKEGELLAFDANFQQGDMVIVVLEGEVAASAQYRALVVDLLPAGFEIDGDSLNGELEQAYPWISNLDATLFVDALDDRYVAAFNTEDLSIDSDNKAVRTFRLAYVLRPVIPGVYSIPPAEIEDMYQPQYRARTGAGTATINK